MTKKDKARFVFKTLNQLYPETPIPLNHKDPYTLLIAVLLSAQCTDARVNQITPKLFALADSPDKMVELNVNQIREIIRPGGLSPRKSKAIYELSEIILQKYQGKVPQNFASLEELPGVGHKTASVVMAQAWGVPAFPVDTHIHRLAWRWTLSSGKNVEETERDLKNLFKKEYWNKLHLQFIYYGREYCPARGHHLEKCIICQKIRRKKGFK